MKKINILYYVLCVLLMSSCYEDYAKDYDYSTTYFASQRPLRTVIADSCLLYTSDAADEL